jgi:predicted nucleic acid-binding protein
MYLLDTNIVSLFDPRRAAEAAAVVDWMREYDSLLFLSSITLTEIEAGIRAFSSSCASVKRLAPVSSSHCAMA